MKRWQNKTVSWGILAMIALLLLCADQTREAAENAILVCAKVMVPVLFPPMVLSLCLVRLPWRPSRPVRRIFAWAFHLPESGATPFLLGLLGGYPMGAQLTAEAVKKKELTPKEAERLLFFSVNPSPAFVIGVAGATLLHRIKEGVILYLILVSAAVASGVVFRPKKRRKSEERPECAPAPFWYTFTGALKDGAQSMLIICAGSVFFSVLLSFCPNRYVGALVDVSEGIMRLSGVAEPILFPMLAFYLGAGGACIAAQIACLLTGTGLSVKTFIKGNLVKALIAAGLGTVYIWLKKTLGL